jgi:hypothetical protein
MIDIAELRAKLAIATPGPWMYDDDGEVVGIEDDEGEIVFSQQVIGTHWPHGAPTRQLYMESGDAELIVAAVNALPALLDELERLRAFVDSLGVDVDEYHDGEWWDGYRQAQREIVMRALDTAHQAGGER